MNKYSGDVQLRGNLDVLSDKPLDTRLVVQTKDDLYTLDPRYAYNGMPVSCIADGAIYMLKDKTYIALNEGWVKCGSSGSGNSNQVVLSEEEYNALEEYSEDTLYFIYEPWGFGSRFPITFSGWGFGEAFPIKLA